jgi:hypothetical protein
MDAKVEAAQKKACSTYGCENDATERQETRLANGESHEWWSCVQCVKEMEAERAAFAGYHRMQRKNGW